MEMKIIQALCGSYIPITAILEIYKNDRGFYIRIIGENKYSIDEDTYNKLAKECR